MKVEEIMSNAVTIKSTETLSKALVKMKQKKFHQLPVVDNELKGMIILKKIITTDVDPSSAKVSSFITSVPKISKQATVESAAEMLIKSGLRALPVLDGGYVVGVVSETDFLNALDKNVIFDSCPECVVVDKSDDVGKVRKLMSLNNISRVPVLDGKKIVGVVDSLQLIDLLLKAKDSYGGRTKGYSDKGYKAAVNVDKLSVTSFLRKALVMNKNSKSSDIIEALKENEEVVLQDGEKFHIITPKDLLSHIAKGSKKGVYVQVSHMEDIDEIDKSTIDQATTEFVQKIGAMMSLDVFNVNIERMQKQGNKTNYSVRTKILTPIGLFVSEAQGWKIVTVFQEAMSKLEKEILKAHQKKSSFKTEQKSRRMTKM